MTQRLNATWRNAHQTWTLRMAASRAGRIALHLSAIPFDRQLRWHFAGIVREFQPASGAYA